MTDDPSSRVLMDAEYYVAEGNFRPEQAIIIAAGGIREASHAIRFWRSVRQTKREAFREAIVRAKAWESGEAERE